MADNLEGNQRTQESCLMKLDRISNLPSDVLDEILSRLPLGDAARTCVLSSKWRYKFVMLPHLFFDGECSSSIVDHVLLSHIGPIRTFNLTQGCKDIRDLDKWFLHLSRYSLEVLVFELTYRPPPQQPQDYKMPWCIFLCQDIIHFELWNCLLKPPSAFKGFRSLKSLTLWDVVLAQNVLENMIHGSPLLERLSLEHCAGFNQLKIDAPSLQFLKFYNSSVDLSVVNGLNVTNVSVVFMGDHCSFSKIIKFFDGLPCIQRLKIGWHILKYLAAGALPENLPQPCLHLKFIEICVAFLGQEDILTALCLLRSCPALEELEIEISPWDWGVNSGTDNSGLPSCSLTQLRHVKIKGISGLEAELEFIQILLLCSPVLETLTVDVTIRNLDAKKSLKLVKKLLSMRRVTRNVEIIYIDGLSM